MKQTFPLKLQSFKLFFMLALLCIADYAPAQTAVAISTPANQAKRVASPARSAALRTTAQAESKTPANNAAEPAKAAVKTKAQEHNRLSAAPASTGNK